MYKRTVEKHIKEYETTFGDFYRPILLNLEDTIEDLLNTYSEQINEKEIILNDIIKSLLYELNRISFRTLLYEFHLTKESTETNTQDHHFKNYIQLLKDSNYITMILDKYEHLNKLINKKINFKIQLIKNIFESFSNDKSKLQQHIDNQIHTIHGIEFSHGDSHNQGKSVTILQTNSGKLVYKPHNLYTDQWFYDILNVLKEDINIDIPEIPLFTVDDYGWQGFISHKPCTNKEEISNYYYRMGIYLSVFYLLKTDDIHYENIMASGEYPFILDLETIVANKKIHSDEEKESLMYTFLESITDSVLGTMILPVNYKFSPFDVDISALSTKEAESNIWLSYVIEDAGTDNIRLIKQPSPLNKKNNKVMLHNKVANPFDFLNSIENGFSHGYDSILKNKHKITEICHSNLVNKIHVRHIPRATSVYAKFLDASTHPTYLRKTETVNMLFNKFKRGTSFTEIKQAESEILALFNHDIPYFTQPLISKNLHCNEVSVIKDYFQDRPIDLVLNRLKNMDKKDKEKQVYYIKMSMVTDGGGSLANIHGNQVLGFQNTEIDSILKEVGNELIDTAIIYKDTCTWMIHEVTDNEKVYIGPLNYSLYDGAGLLIFLLELASYSDNKKYLQYAEMGLKGLVTDVDLSKIDSYSIFHGLGSYLYLYARFYNTTQKSEYYNKLLDGVKNLNITYKKDLNIDFIGGLSGMIVFLTNCYRAYGDEIFYKKAHEFAELMISIYKEKTEFLNGLAHGRAGISLSLASLYEINNDAKISTEVYKVLKQENLHFNSTDNNWTDLREFINTESVYWCHGAPGISLARMKTIQYLGINDLLNKDLTCGIRKTLQDGFSDYHDSSLCHGVFGNLDILIEINKYKKCETLRHFIDSTFSNYIDNLTKFGYQSGIKNSLPINNFMLGKFGIAYTLLRYKNNKIPCILSLDI
ncbi:MULTISPECIES: type 2 lanthipeptide synthetase LanM family protein [Bacillus cereus group]|uniref:type 2 lanthipeptide synthetase LanM family protein n=1 Tax=Bacillus cereus group TaxID=86661 RepID=UPI00159B8DD5|nr:MULTISPECIES: type 2 lanthipeptide synthetase LanM family protein [Bacillus cereus group]MED3447807.1 type 2 lanthipeptide synthetase LanM family protein [Bacillus thuringiensis]MED4441512.1 type 2 lanthipeptide synthetase LanM family protein [Bacillus cereus]